MTGDEMPLGVVASTSEIQGWPCMRAALRNVRNERSCCLLSMVIECWVVHCFSCKGCDWKPKPGPATGGGRAKGENEMCVWWFDGRVCLLT